MKRLGPNTYLMGVCFVLGVLIAVQLRSTRGASSLSLTTSDQAGILAALVQSNAALRDEVTELEAQVQRLDVADRQASNAALVSELNRLLVVSGGVQASGPGVRVNVSGQINPLDMQDLINELRNAGAEALALNHRRIAVRSVVGRDGSNLILDGETLVAPYVLEAIGQPDTIGTALLRRGGLVDLLEFAYPGLNVSVTQADSLTLPARVAKDEFKFAQPVPSP